MITRKNSFRTQLCKRRAQNWSINVFEVWNMIIHMWASLQCLRNNFSLIADHSRERERGKKFGRSLSFVAHIKFNCAMIIVEWQRRRRGKNLEITTHILVHFGSAQSFICHKHWLTCSFLWCDHYSERKSEMHAHDFPLRCAILAIFIYTNFHTLNLCVSSWLRRAMGNFRDKKWCFHSRDSKIFWNRWHLAGSDTFFWNFKIFFFLFFSCA